MIGRYHQLSEHEFDQTLGDGEGQVNLAYCSPWDCKESDMTEQLNNNKRNVFPFIYLYFCFPCLRKQVERISKTDAKECTANVFFKELYDFRYYIQVFNPF